VMQLDTPLLLPVSLMPLVLKTGKLILQELAGHCYA
jgi:hypothetical protein